VAAKGSIAGLTATRSCPVMILDGEATLGEWESRDHRLRTMDGLTPDGRIFYRRLSRSLDTEAPAIRAEISRLGVGLVIVDSFGMAAGSEPEGADAAIRLLSTLRSLGPTVTVLLICHVSNVQADQKHGSARPYGSIYVQALGRSIWECRRDDDGGDDVRVALYHRKSNTTKLHAPVALRFQFTETAIRVQEATIGERPELVIRASLLQQLHAALSTGHKTIPALASELDQKPDTIEKNLRRHPKAFVMIPGAVPPYAWGLVAKR
jgi:hypothetical protein